MQRTFLFSIIILIIVIAGCAHTYVEKMVTSQGAVIELNGARLEIPANSLSESTLVRLEKRGVAKRKFTQGYALSGEAYAVLPENLTFSKAAVLSCAALNEREGLGAKLGNGFIPLSNAETSGGRVMASIWHGGEYYLIDKPEEYGIVAHTKSDEGLLIVCDIYVSDYIDRFQRTMRQSGYDLPVWLFVYQPDRSIEENAQLLHGDLQRLHNEQGIFRLDVVSFGIGGLVTHRYLTDSAYYLRDISSAVIAIGTPFLGSNFAILENAKAGLSPFRFVLVDGLARNAEALAPRSEFISRIKEKRHLPGFHYYDDPSENKNFVSLHGRSITGGRHPEETAGDGLVSLKSAMLTAIEPAPFEVSHFDLFESDVLHRVAIEFAMLYRSFNWPMLFSSVWSGRESFSKINETWAREVKLHLRDDIDFDALLEYNRNMLMSAPDSAVLITNGDYDTYPAWYLQGKGIRTDVLVVNRSLINIKDCAKFLLRQGLPLEITDRELLQLEHQKKGEKFVTISDQLIQSVLKQTSRPVVFSTTVYDPQQYGYPLKLSGLVYEVKESDIDVARTQKLLYEVFEYKKIFSRPLDSFNPNIQSIAKNYAAIAFSLSSALDKPGEYDDALEAIAFAKRFGEEPVFCCSEAQLYFKLHKKSEAVAALDRALAIKGEDTDLRKEIAKVYFENGMKENAIKVLAAGLAHDPEDKELPVLIKKYQGE